MTKRNIITGFIIIAIVLVGVYYFLYQTKTAPRTGLPNPASVHCEEVGGTLDIRTGADGGQTGYCTLPDKTVCEEWALLRNQCFGQAISTLPKPGLGGEDFRNLDINVGDKIASPLQIAGEVKGGWFFEGSFPISLADGNGKIIATSTVEAKSDWMTTDYVSFTAELKFAKPASDNLTGAIIFKNDNPSGLPANDKSYQLPIKF